jgi:dihydroorotate dehydrogenase (fumarate)
MGNEMGEAWTSGPVIKPIALAIINKIKSAVPDFTIIGAGGIESAEDVVEFLLAGADAVQMLSAAMLRGKDLYEKILGELPKTLKKLDFISIEDVINTPLQKGEVKYHPSFPAADKEKCTLCGICQRVCPYFAINVTDSVHVDCSACFGCGLCESRCPVKAISGAI